MLKATLFPPTTRLHYCPQQKCCIFCPSGDMVRLNRKWQKYTSKQFCVLVNQPVLWFYGSSDLSSSLSYLPVRQLPCHALVRSEPYPRIVKWQQMIYLLCRLSFGQKARSLLMDKKKSKRECWRPEGKAGALKSIHIWLMTVNIKVVPW